jgi:hypothetical protein
MTGIWKQGNIPLVEPSMLDCSVASFWSVPTLIPLRDLDPKGKQIGQIINDSERGSATAVLYLLGNLVVLVRRVRAFAVVANPETLDGYIVD